MNGRCGHSPHRGHYWVEEIPESDKWECRWCGQVRHFNQERAENAQMSETNVVANEYVSQQWLYGEVAGKVPRRVREGSLEFDFTTRPLLPSA